MCCRGVDDVTGLAPLVDVRELEHCILGLGGTINYKHFYDPTGKGCCGGNTSDSDGGNNHANNQQHVHHQTANLLGQTSSLVYRHASVQ